MGETDYCPLYASTTGGLECTRMWPTAYGARVLSRRTSRFRSHGKYYVGLARERYRSPDGVWTPQDHFPKTWTATVICWSPWTPSLNGSRRPPSRPYIVGGQPTSFMRELWCAGASPGTFARTTDRNSKGASIGYAIPWALLTIASRRAIVRPTGKSRGRSEP